MPEIKLTDRFADELTEFRNSGKELETVNVYTVSRNVSDEGANLPTVGEYEERLWEISRAVFTFNTLVGKDADDLTALANSLITADAGDQGGVSSAMP